MSEIKSLVDNVQLKGEEDDRKLWSSTREQIYANYVPDYTSSYII